MGIDQTQAGATGRHFSQWWSVAGAALVAYTLWWGHAALAAWVIAVARQVLARLVVALRAGYWMMGAVDKVAIVVALAWLVWVLYTEAVLRRAIRGGTMRVCWQGLRLLVPTGTLLVLQGIILLLVR